MSDWVGTMPFPALLDRLQRETQAEMQALRAAAREMPHEGRRCGFIGVKGTTCDGWAVPTDWPRWPLCSRHAAYASRSIRNFNDHVYRRAWDRGLVSQAEALWRAEDTMREAMDDWAEQNDFVYWIEHAPYG